MKLENICNYALFQEAKTMCDELQMCKGLELGSIIK